MRFACLPFLLLLASCQGGPLREVGPHEFKALFPRGETRYKSQQLREGDELDREIVPAEGAFKGGPYRLQAELLDNGDSLDVGAILDSVALSNGWLDGVTIRVIPVKFLPKRKNPEDFDEVFKTRQGKLVTANKDHEKAHFRAVANFRKVELLWQPSEVNPSKLEETNFVVSVLLSHRSKGYTRRVLTVTATRPKN